ncbi:MAG: magnesium/cobalt transporter CorA [Promethearchaeota archaeon]
MTKLIKNISKKRGLPPGSLVYIGNEISKKPEISSISYTNEKFSKKKINNLEDIKALLGNSDIKWINIIGITDAKTIEKIGSFIHLHHLHLEDIMNTEQRSKIVIYEDGIFVVLKSLSYSLKDNHLEQEQISLILGNKFLFSLKESENDLFDEIEERLYDNIGSIRALNEDYLLYSLMDIIVDNYLTILEEIAGRIEKNEKELIFKEAEDTLNKILSLKRTCHIVLKNALQIKEIFNKLSIAKTEIILEETFLFFNDIHDHVLYIIETIQSFHNMLFEMQNIYLSNMSNKMNEIMKVLTIISTIFIPITFITGFYGMNLNFLPGIDNTILPILLIVIMMIITILMIMFFKKKRWL